MANDTRTPLGQGCGAAGFGVQRDPALQGDRSTQELPAAAAGSGPLRCAPSPPGGRALPGSPALVPPGSLLGCPGGSREGAAAGGRGRYLFAEEFLVPGLLSLLPSRRSGAGQCSELCGLAGGCYAVNLSLRFKASFILNFALSVLAPEITALCVPAEREALAVIVRRCRSLSGLSPYIYFFS